VFTYLLFAVDYRVRGVWLRAMVYICVASTEMFPVKIVMHTLRNLFLVNVVRFTRSGKSFELAYDHLYCTTWRLAPARAGETFSGRIPKLFILQGEILWRLEA